jgi:DNA-binding NtrC family response regulator
LNLPGNRTTKANQFIDAKNDTQVGEDKMNSNFAVQEDLMNPNETAEVATAPLTVVENSAPAARPTLRSLRAAAEIIAIRHALQETGWNRKRAARLLSISYRGLLYKLRQHRIVPQSEDQRAS